METLLHHNNLSLKPICQIPSSEDSPYPAMEDLALLPYREEVWNGRQDLSATR
jgi:hypothetical protein